jgi:glycosyltransferase involved in cell wall biosynthesis
MKRLTLSVPCYGRPQRTIRAINSIAKQTVNDWEALVIGDGCPVMQDFIDSNYFNDIITECKNKGNDLFIRNNKINQGGHGFAITNHNIQIAKGKYFMFFANDDILLQVHFENYLSQIEDTDLDFVYFNSFVKPNNSIRNSSLQYGSIGHSELIIRTDFLKQIPQHDAEYGHDWALIKNMIDIGGKNKKSSLLEPSYYVMSLSDKRETGID